MLNVYPDSFQLNLVTPLGPERTRARFEWYLPDPARADAREELERAIAFTEQVRRENGGHHFHGLLHRFVVASPTPGR